MSNREINEQTDDQGNFVDVEDIQIQEWIESSKLLAEEKQQEYYRKRIIKEEEDMLQAMSLSKKEQEERRQAIEEEELIKLQFKLNKRESELEFITQKIVDKLKFRFSLDSDFNEIELLFNEFERNTNTLLLDEKRTRSSQSMNGKSALILEVIRLLKDRGQLNVEKVLNFFKNHIWNIRKAGGDKSYIFLYDPEIHNLDKMSEFSHKSLEDKFVPVHVKGDGNCLWNSVSVALFGDYSMMESLRLLTASTLLDHQDNFTKYLQRQKSKYGYSHELTFDGLVTAATELQVWGDELHIMALSLALRRPIFSYGSLSAFHHNITFEQLKREFENEPFYNHFKYVADTLFDNQTPILLYYNGENHYSVVLPLVESAQPLIPKTQILDPLISYEPTRSQVQDEKVNGVSSRQENYQGNDLTTSVENNQDQINSKKVNNSEIELKNKLKKYEKNVEFLKKELLRSEKEKSQMKLEKKKFEEELQVLKLKLFEQNRRTNLASSNFYNQTGTQSQLNSISPIYSYASVTGSGIGSSSSVCTQKDRNDQDKTDLMEQD